MGLVGILNELMPGSNFFMEYYCLPIPKDARRSGKVDLYITAKNVPPITINIEGVSINGPIPPEETIAPAIIPSVPTKPII